MVATAHTEVGAPAWCCWVSCLALAEWEIWHGDRDVDYTHACTEHVGVLLTDAGEHRVYPLPAPGVLAARKEAHESN